MEIITIQVEDKEKFISALNNAIVALNQVRVSLLFCCDVPDAFDKFLTKEFGNDQDKKLKHITNKLEILHKVYKQL